jgi:hypothetical protein
MINHRDKLDIIEFFCRDDKYIVKKTTERPEVNIRSNDNKLLLAKIDYEILRATIITKDGNEIQNLIECLKRCEKRLQKELTSTNEFTVV